jgi:hypothetical protein
MRSPCERTVRAKPPHNASQRHAGRQAGRHAGRQARRQAGRQAEHADACVLLSATYLAETANLIGVSACLHVLHVLNLHLHLLLCLQATGSVV